MSEALRDELTRGIDQVIATENHLLEVIIKLKKESNNEIKEDLRDKVDKLRLLRQKIAIAAEDILSE